MFFSSAFLDSPRDVTELLSWISHELRHLIRVGPPPLWPPLAGSLANGLSPHDWDRFVVEGCVMELMGLLHFSFRWLTAEGECRAAADRLEVCEAAHPSSNCEQRRGGSDTSRCEFSVSLSARRLTSRNTGRKPWVPHLLESIG